MSKFIAAALAGVIATSAVAAAPTVALAQAAAAAKPSVETTKISDIVANAKAKAVVEKILPMLSEYYDQIGTMTLKDVQPLSQGAITDENLKQIQAEFDKL